MTAIPHHDGMGPIDVPDDQAAERLSRALVEESRIAAELRKLPPDWPAMWTGPLAAIEATSIKGGVRLRRVWPRSRTYGFRDVPRLPLGPL